MVARPVHILLVEDNPADAYWMQMQLRELRLDCVVSIAADGEYAVDLILKRGAVFDLPEPHIIFLDINLPKLSGIDVLNALQDDKKYPVCVVSGSRSEQEFMRERFKLDARCYAIKPVSPESILDAFDCFDHLKELAAELRSRLNATNERRSSEPSAWKRS